MKLSLSLSFVIATGVSAQQSAWAQCGGINWSGGTTCVSGYSCVKLNDYYSQCTPGGGATTSTPATTLSTSTTTTTGTTSVPTAAPTGSFPSISNGKFVIDGKAGYFAGTNSYWIGFLTNNADVDLTLEHLRTSGVKVLRVWGFNDVNNIPGSGTVWFQSLSGSTPTINTGANGLQRLDYLVKSAEAHGIKLIINFINNWDAYGGITAYTNYYGGTHQQWFTNSAAQAQYKTYIKAVVSRYINSPAIFAWELANEIRCSGCATSVITNWATTISQYIKSLDSKHLVTLGDEGMGVSAGDGSYPYGTSDGVSFAANINIKTLDFGTYHLYPDSWSVNAASWPVTWIQEHGKVCAAAGKPCVLEEYGYAANHGQEVSWQKAVLASNGNEGDMFWQDGETLSYGRSPDDGYTLYYGSGDWTSLVTNHVADIKASGK